MPDLTVIATPDDDPDSFDSPKRRLTASQRLQVAVWIVEGYSAPEIVRLVDEHGFPAISEKGVQYYKYRCPELLQEAREYLRRGNLLVGMAEKANRLRALQEHAARLKQLIDECELVEVDERQVGYGKNAQVIKTKKFAASLSKEYRDTLKQIQAEIEPVEQAVTVVNQQNNVWLDLSDADRQQMLNAMSWTPQELPVIIESEAHSAPPIDADPPSEPACITGVQLMPATF